jgi:hypothetical protein
MTINDLVYALAKQHFKLVMLMEVVKDVRHLAVPANASQQADLKQDTTQTLAQLVKVNQQ